MPKLDLRTRQDLMKDLSNPLLEDWELLEVYGISERQLFRYKKMVKDNETNKEEIKEEVKTAETDAGDVEPSTEEKPVRERTEEAQERAEIEPADLFVKKDEEPQDPTNEEDEDVCGECQSNGERTVLKKGWKNCPACGSELEWG